MSSRTSERSLADVLGALVSDHEPTDLLADLVATCAALLPADAAALLVDDGHGRLELLSATSHRAAELELYQAQQDSGPCVDAVRTGEALSAVGEADITGRWPDVGAAIVAAGFLAVHAFPMTWRGQALGGLNVFSQNPQELAASSRAVARSLADVATLALTQPAELGNEELADRVQAALEGRVVVERAKGVLAQTLDLDMETAYDHLVHRALETHSTLSQTARQVVHDAHHP
ncbi:GAF and ANTAR domain-containing protein [Cellulomonas sp. URHD0024]|uniref:GAF and ANTAR domain-containing protein n=1 Tax=Cellulomonas sp. URHD0024 TaxID=1302620 RepID=UPI00040AA6CE|nr:GAF and ANTAR domain-containing protein [Cellulomonas sp. URHD0024]